MKIVAKNIKNVLTAVNFVHETAEICHLGNHNGRPLLDSVAVEVRPLGPYSAEITAMVVLRDTENKITVSRERFVAKGINLLSEMSTAAKLNAAK